MSLTAGHLSSPSTSFIVHGPFDIYIFGKPYWADFATVPSPPLRRLRASRVWAEGRAAFRPNPDLHHQSGPARSPCVRAIPPGAVPSPFSVLLELFRVLACSK